MKNWQLSLTLISSFAPLVTFYHSHLSSSAIFLSLSFFSFSISFKISRRRSTSAWALLDSSRYRVTSLSSCCIRSLSSGLALASSVASWACKKKVPEKSNSFSHTYFTDIATTSKGYLDIYFKMARLTNTQKWTYSAYATFKYGEISSRKRKIQKQT